MATYNALEFGEKLRYHRLQLGWSAQKLAELYSEFVGREDSPPSPVFIYRVEAGVTKLETTRRAILASLVGMSLPFDALHEERSMLIDVSEYTQTLELYCGKWRDGTLRQEAGAIQERIRQLEAVSFHAFGEEKKTMRELFGFYQILHADVWGGQKPSTAYYILSSAVETAKEEKLPTLLVYTLSQRAGIGIGRFETTRNRKGLQGATNDYTNAAKEASNISPFYRGLFYMRKGLLDAYIARDKKEFTDALHLITQGSNQVGSSADDVRIIARLDCERYMLNRASAYLYSPMGDAKLGLAQLAELEREYPQAGGKARLAHRNRLFAEAYLATGDYPMAAAYLEVALETASAAYLGAALERASEEGINLLAEIHARLKNTSYWNDPDTGRISVKINQIKYPELFH